MTESLRRTLATLGVLVLLASAAWSAQWHAARAQMMLPGGGGSPTGASPKEGGGGSGGDEPRAPPKPIVVKPPGEDAIAGHLLARDGITGAMTFDKAGADLVLSKLSLTGAKISAPAKDCSIDVALASPIVAAPAGRPEGALRYKVAVPACPYAIDVLEGAVLVSTQAPTCDFAAADCRVTLAGLWGPRPADITPKQAKDLERERVRIETTMRANFRVLLKRAGRDRDAVKAIAREQAGFSSEREMTCRDYAQESVHGFCSTRITEARVLALLAKFGLLPDHPEEHRHAARPKPKPAAPALQDPPSQDPPSQAPPSQVPQ